MKTSKQSNKKSEKTANTHVVALTIPSRYKTPLHDDFIVLSDEARHAMQFHLRQMWAITLVQNMKEGQGWDWEGITKVTGKSRQAWNYACFSKFSTLAELNDSVYGEEARSGYRPVSSAFIRSVTEKIETYNWTVFTKHFRSVWDLGLCVLVPSGSIMGADVSRGSVSKWTLDRIGDTYLTPTDDEEMMDQGHQNYRKGKEIISWINLNEPTQFVYYIKGKDSHGDLGPQYYQYASGGYPLLDCYDFQWGRHNCWEAHCVVESMVFDVINAETGEPDPRAKEWHKEWEQEQLYKEASDQWVEPPKPADPAAFKSKPKDPALIIDDLDWDAPDVGDKMKEKLEEKLEEKKENWMRTQLTKLFEHRDGFDIDQMMEWINTGQSVAEATKGKDHEHVEIVKVDPETRSETNTIMDKINLLDLKTATPPSDPQGDYLPPVVLNFDQIDRKFLSEDGTGKIEFSAVIKYRHGMKVGHSIEIKGWSEGKV